MDLSLWVFVGIFLTGLALNLTPCVYPMLSVTVALFNRKEHKSIGPSFLKSSVYVSGMAFMYSTLGVIAALTGGFFGSALQSPWVLFAISALMLVLALSMFGVYEFQIPSGLLTWISQKKGTGYIGLFLMGLFVGIFAAPCIGPPIVGLLTLVGQSGNPVFGFFIFFVLALGLGFPYLIIGTFSGLITKIPKSGAWMVWVKKIFGFILLGLSLFYLSLALYPEFLFLVVPAVLGAGGIYLGFWDRTGNESAAFKKIKMAVGSLTVLLAIFLLVGKPSRHVVWEEYSAEKLSMAKEQGKPVVVDFYADWCIPCHELERYTYSDADVIEALGPFVKLKVDVSDPSVQKALEPIERFDISGVPTILFLDAAGREVPKTRLTGYLPPAEFLEHVHPALELVTRKEAIDD